MSEESSVCSCDDGRANQKTARRRREEGELESLSLSSARTRSVRQVHLAAPRQSASREDAHSGASPEGADFVLVVRSAVCSGEVEPACLSRPGLLVTRSLELVAVAMPIHGLPVEHLLLMRLVRRFSRPRSSPRCCVAYAWADPPSVPSLLGPIQTSRLFCRRALPGSVLASSVRYELLPCVSACASRFAGVGKSPYRKSAVPRPRPLFLLHLSLSRYVG